MKPLSEPPIPSPLANRTYRRLFAAQVVALVGTGLTTIALTLLAYELAGSGAGEVIGIAFALKMAVYVFGAPLIAGLAGHLPRRPLLVTLDLLRAATVCAMPFVDQVWQVCVLIVLVNASSAGFTPTFQATIPEVLPDERVYTRALSLSRLAYELENLASPGIAAVALTLVGYDALFAANGVAFVFSALLVLSSALPGRRKAFVSGSSWERVTRGIRLYLATPRLRGLLLLSFAVALASAMVIVNTVVYVQDEFARSESHVAWAMGASGAGAMAAALVLPRVLDRVRDRAVMLAGGTILVAGLGLAILPISFTALLPIWFLLGIGLSLIQTPAGRLLQRSAQAPDRPALFAAQFALSHACWLLTYPLAGFLGSTIGLRTTAGLFALGSSAAVLVTMLAWPAPRRAHAPAMGASQADAGVR